VVSDRYDDLVRQLRQPVLEGAGVTQPALRQAVAAHAAALGGGTQGPGPGVPPEVRALVDKIARRASTVTDADVQAVRQSGYSESAVFEVTAAAAMGAALGRLERGLAALKGEA
jgi:alkylhydroperoxidase family enzyme